MNTNANLDEKTSHAQVLIIEPFYGGSHKQLIDCIQQVLETNQLENNNRNAKIYDLFTLPAKKWKWRLRTSSLWFAECIPQNHKYQVLFCSSMLNLSDLIAVRSDLRNLRKIIYFHENQLNYPVRVEKDRDIQFGWNQITSALVADQVYFNSLYNMTSFINEIGKFMKVIPDHRPQSTATTIQKKSKVLYFPVLIQPQCPVLPRTGPLTILWNHRWEYDKDPDAFFQAMYALKEQNVEFKLVVIGESFAEVSPIFEEAKQKLVDHIKVWGFLDSKQEYYRVLAQESDIVVSTTQHEFLGISVIEAIVHGCYPLCPNRLVFPEYIPEDHLYNTNAQLIKKLRYYGKNPEKLRNGKWKINLDKFDWNNLKSEYASALSIIQ